MSGKSIYSHKSLDEIRAENPDIGVAVYAYSPGEPVTLEAHTPDGGVFTWTAPTLMDAIREAFPTMTDTAEDPALPEPTQPTDIFA